jgi:TPR repeat protein
MVHLAVRYHDGQGVEKNPELARKWVSSAANAGDPLGLTTLGWFRESGTLFPKDDAEAARLYYRAAQANQPVALFRLGLMYAQGRGVQRDDNIALDLIRRSARLGNLDAQKLLKDSNQSW